jgi:putative ABC transport system permease protein
VAAYSYDKRFFAKPHIWFIALVGVIVPRRLRADWRQEWEAELRCREQLLAEWDRLDWRSKLDLLQRSLSAFWDALWLQPQRLEDEMFQDLRYGVRMLFKSPGFTTVAVLTLALGIGANTVIFGLINTVLLKPLSGREPERLIGVYSHDTTRADSYRLFSHPNYTDLRAQQVVFDDLLATNLFGAGVTEGETTRSVTAVKVSSNYFSVFGVQLAQGRPFLTQEETQPAPVAIVSYRWWQQRGAPPDLVGQSMRVNGRLLTVVGIAPQGFTGAISFFSPDLFLPLSFDQPGSAGGGPPLQDRNRHDLMLVGRLKRGLTLDEANARLKILSAQLAEAYPGTNRDQLITVAPLPRLAISSAPRNDRGQIAAISALALSLSCAVLLIACLNLANMLLARGAARRKEFAVRLALGARAGRLARQLLTEGFLLAALGGVAGLALSALAIDWLTDSLEQVMPVSLNLDARPDLRVLGVTLGFSLLATLFFALGPALKAVRLDVSTSLKEGPGGDARASRQWRPRNLLVIGQVALSLCLLVAAGLVGRGAFQAIRIDPGFDLDRAFYLQLDGGLAGYDEEQTRQLYNRLTERVRSLPGVEAASLALTPPFGEFTFGQRVQPGGAPYPPPPDAATAAQGRPVAAHYNVVGPDFFRTLGIPLRRGREFRQTELAGTGAPREVIISTTLAEKLWPGEEALARTIRLAGGSDADDPGTGAFIPSEGRLQQTFEVVGIIQPYRDQLLPPGDHPLVFVPFSQDYHAAMHLLVRVSPGASVDTVLRAAREEARRLDAILPVLTMKSLRLHLETSLGVWLLHISALLFGTFGAVALLMSLIGVYGVNAYLVAQRTREIGIRMALGADRRVVLRLFLREGLALTGVSLGLGLVLAGLVAQMMRGILFEVSPFDPLVFGAASALLAFTALIACWLPARRATKVDPLIALRHE